MHVVQNFIMATICWLYCTCFENRDFIERTVLSYSAKKKNNFKKISKCSVISFKHYSCILRTIINRVPTVYHYSINIKCNFNLYIGIFVKRHIIVWFVLFNTHKTYTYEKPNT